VTPKRLLPYLLIFLALAVSYWVLQWDLARRQALDLEAKKVFKIKEGEIGELALIKGKEEIRLVKQGQEWSLRQPLKARADQETIKSMVATLAHLAKERDLGAGQDLKAFGLEKPPLLVEFSSQGTSHRLAVGGKAPGERAYYALKDQERQVLLVSAGDIASLDRPLAALRDKTLFTFSLETVKGLKIRTGNTVVALEKTGPWKWRQTGREGFPVRADRVEALVRQLHAFSVKDFVAEAPQDLRPYGLAPRTSAQVSVIWEKGEETLLLGAKAPNGIFARRGAEGPVIVVDSDLPGQIAKTVASLEDRRLWAGTVTEVQKVVWGQPEKTWVGVKEKDFWKITGPGGQEVRRPAVRLDMGLWKLTELEYERLVPGAASPAKGPVYLLALSDGAGKELYRMEEMGRKGETGVEVRTYQGDKGATALISWKDYRAWQEEMERLTATPPKKD
jgi:hypothetical protein